jgi:hypothetical protein
VNVKGVPLVQKTQSAIGNQLFKATGRPAIISYSLTGGLNNEAIKKLDYIIRKVVLWQSGP